MMSTSGAVEERLDATELLTLDRHVAAWRIGTGLRLALSPGTYRVTGRVTIAGRDYLVLDGNVRVESIDALLE